MMLAKNLLLNLCAADVRISFFSDFFSYKNGYFLFLPIIY